MKHETRTAKEIAKELAQFLLCDCDLDKWIPERSTGHTLECRIHLFAIEQAKHGYQKPHPYRVGDFAKSDLKKHLRKGSRGDPL